MLPDGLKADRVQHLAYRNLLPKLVIVDARRDGLGSRPLCCIGFGGGRWFLGSVGAVRFTADLQQDGPVHDAIQKGHCQRRIAQVFTPSLEVDVRGQGRGSLATAGVDDLVEEVRCLRTLAAFNAVESEFVDDQEIEPRPVTDAAGKGLVGQRRPQILQQVGAGGVANAVPQFAVAAGQRL